MKDAYFEQRNMLQLSRMLFPPNVRICEHSHDMFVLSYLKLVVRLSESDECVLSEFRHSCV
jgi:hypothetical protein